MNLSRQEANYLAHSYRKESQEGRHFLFILCFHFQSFESPQLCDWLLVLDFKWPLVVSLASGSYLLCFQLVKLCY